VDWAIIKAEEEGKQSDGQVGSAAAALREEFPDVSQEEAISYARSLRTSLDIQRTARAAKKAAEQRKSAHRPVAHPVPTGLNVKFPGETSLPGSLGKIVLYYLLGIGIGIGLIAILLLLIQLV